MQLNTAWLNSKQYNMYFNWSNLKKINHLWKYVYVARVFNKF